MVRTQSTPGFSSAGEESYQEHLERIAKLYIKSYEDYLEKGHQWCWCLVGNVVKEHEFGEDKEIRYGTKQFRGGTKVYLAPVQWGDGYECVIVIGMARNTHKYIEVIMRSKYIENFRMQRVYKPAIVKRMLDSEHRWWCDSEDDRKDIIEYLKTRAPEEYEKEKAKLEAQGEEG